MDVELADSWLFLRRFGSGFLVYLREVRSEVLTDSRHVIRSIRVTRDAVGTDVRDRSRESRGCILFSQLQAPLELLLQDVDFIEEEHKVDLGEHRMAANVLEEL